MRGSEPPEKRRPEASVVWFFDGVVFADEADPGTGMRLSPGLRVTLKDMALAKLHCRHPVVHLLLGLCQTSEVHARYLDPDAFGHMALACVLLDRRSLLKSIQTSKSKRGGPRGDTIQ